MMKIFEIIVWAGIGLSFIGFGLLSLVQARHASLNGGYYRSILKKPIASDIKLLKIGAFLACLGILLIVIGAVVRN